MHEISRMRVFIHICLSWNRNYESNLDIQPSYDNDVSILSCSFAHRFVYMPLLVIISFRCQIFVQKRPRIIRALFDREPYGLPAASLMRLCLSSFYSGIYSALMRAHGVISKRIDFPRGEYARALF